MDFSRISLITHANCLDGSACALLFLAAGGQKNNIYFSSPDHSKVEECLGFVLTSSDYDIILADVSISDKYASKLRCVDRLLLLDHHKGSLSLAKHNWCQIDEKNKNCGSKMFFNWLLEQSFESREKVRLYSDLIALVDDNDRWIHKDSRSVVLSTFHYVLGQKLFVDRFIRNVSTTLTDRELYVIGLEEEKKKEFIQKTMKQVCVRSFCLGDKNLKAGYVLSNSYQSELGHLMCESLDFDIDVAVIVGTSRISLRTKKNCEDIDLSVVSKLNGGGGGLSAAGCDLNKVLGENLLEMVASKFRWQ